MTCPHCNVAAGSKVIDSRSVADVSGERTRRRKACLACGGRYTTYEFIEPDPVKTYTLPVISQKGRGGGGGRPVGARNKARGSDWLARILSQIDKVEGDWAKIN